MMTTHNSKQIGFIGLTLMALLLVVSWGGSAYATGADAAKINSEIQVDPQLLAEMQADGRAGYLIYFANKADLSPAYEMDWDARGHFVVNALQAVAEASQKNVRAYLDAQGVAYQHFWIDNIVVVESSSLEVLNGLLAFSEIASIQAEVENFLIEPERASSPAETALPEAELANGRVAEPNLVQVKAPDVWALGIRGQGTVIANIDSGVRFTHQALVNQYRGNLGGGTFNHNYNWLDPDGGTSVPTDTNGHGTHVMGTMVGYDGGVNEIGVAPDAEWIACRGCLTSSCPQTALLACAQWVAAPHPIGNPGSPDPSKRPMAVNNSWGNCQQSYNNWYQGSVDAWHAAGIIPVFANGNASNCGYSSPPGLNTVGNPARYGNVTGVGSSGTSNGQYANHSNWGPTDNPDTVNPQPGWADLKPQVLAPGVSIRSSLNSGDAAYGSSGWTGTSMSAPHVTGMIALMWQAAPCLIGDYATTETIIEQTATPIPYNDLGTGPRSPNYATGWGEINILAAVGQAQAICGPSGTIEGVVTDSGSSAPIAGAQIEATLNITTTKTATTNALGEYTINFAPEGTYTMTAGAFGYLPGLVTNVAVISGSVTIQNFALTPAPSYEVSGTVTDVNTGWPLYASISVDGVPGSPVWNDPVTGEYSIVLPAGAAYDFTVTAVVNGYLAEERVVGPFNSNITEDFALNVDSAACTAPGYSLSYLYLEDFEADNGGYVVNGTPADHWQWGTPVTWPSSCPSGTNCWGTNLNGNYANSANTTVTSPVIDLSGAVAPLTARWWQAWHIESATWDKGFAEVSIDGGPWLVMWEHTGGTIQVNWTEFTYDISAAAGTNVQFRFRLTSDGSVNFNGYYFDRVAIAEGSACGPAAGGLVVGNVYDDNTGSPLTGAQVANEAGTVATAMVTADPGVDDALYTIFAPAGSTTLTATHTSQYSPAVANLSVANGTTQLYNFDLPAGWLVADPDEIEVTVELGSSSSTTLDLNNLGDAAVNWEISARDEGYAPFATEQILVVRWEALNADAMQAALTNLGYTFLPVTDAVFRTIPVSELLEYEAVFYAGAAPVDSLPFLTAYLDAGGSLLIADNDLGFFRGTTPFYQVYLQATYVEDNAGDFLTGEDLMAGLDLDITPDPFPDGFTVGAEATRIFKYTISELAGGSAIERLDYRAIYLSFDMHRIVGVADRDEVVSRTLDFLVGGEVPWLTMTPITGTLPALGTQLITLDFDAGIAEVPEPGVYSALMRVANDTPYGRLEIPVTMNVTASPTLGLLEGVVQSQGYCDNNPFPAAGAEIVITSGANSWTRTADENGYYYIYLDESHSPVDVAVSAPEHIGDSATGLVLVGQQTTVQDFDLRWLRPCIDVDPDELSQTLPFGQTAQQTLTLGNSGAFSLTFELREQDGGFSPAFAVQPAAQRDIGDSWETMAPLPAGRVFNAVVADGNGYVYVIGGTSDAGGATATNTNYRYDTSSNTWSTMAPMPASLMSVNGVEVNNKIYIPGDATTATTYVYDIATNSWSNIPANGGYTARSQFQIVAIDNDVYVLGGIVAADSASTTQVWKLDTTAQTWSAGVPMQKTRTSFSAAAIDGEIYVAGGVAFPGFAPDMTAEKFDGTSWSYIANVPGGGDLTRWSYNAAGHGADGLWLAAGRRDTGWNVLNHAGYYDPTTDTWTTSPTIPVLSQGRVYMEGAVATDGYFYVIGGRDSAGAIVYANNERLYVGYPAGEVDWLSQDPVSGVVAPDGGELEIAITFDAGAVAEPGDYFATLRVVSNDPMMGSYAIPVTMTVEPSDTAGRIEGVVQSLGYCDLNPFPAEGAEVVITSGANSWTVFTNAAGEYGIWLDESYSPVDISVTAPNHTSGAAAGVVIVGQEVTVVDFDLRLLEACIAVDPTAFDVALGMGGTASYELTISNAGAGELSWEIDEAAMPTVQIPLAPVFVSSPAAIDRANDAGLTAEPAARQILPTASPVLMSDWSQGFEDINQLPGLGWALINNSQPLGATGWFQGNTTVFSAHQGPADSYIGANFNNTGSIGTISNWLITPEMLLQDGATISFYTRTADGSIWADRLELRMSLNGGSTDVGSTATSVGDFTTLLLSVNPDQASTGYPQVWTEYTATLSGIGTPTSGRLAFRYFVTDAGASGTNSNYIGIDTVEYELGVPPVGCVAPEDIPWLSVVPASGTTPADGESAVNVNFDATGLAAGDYEALLCVNSNDPMMPLVEIPVALTVADPEPAITLSVTVSLDDECGTADTLSVAPGSVVYYCYTVTNIGNIMLPNHTITDSVHGPMTSFVYDLMPGMSESVIISKTITADAVSTVQWMAEHPGMAMSAMAEDTVTVTVTMRYLYLPIIMKP
jgi:subtilisin family serine protease